MANMHCAHIVTASTSACDSQRRATATVVARCTSSASPHRTPFRNTSRRRRIEHHADVIRDDALASVRRLAHDPCPSTNSVDEPPPSRRTARQRRDRAATHRVRGSSRRRARVRPSTSTKSRVCRRAGNRARPRVPVARMHDVGRKTRDAVHDDDSCVETRSVQRASGT